MLKISSPEGMRKPVMIMTGAMCFGNVLVTAGHADGRRHNTQHTLPCKT